MADAGFGRYRIVWSHCPSRSHYPEIPLCVKRPRPRPSQPWRCARPPRRAVATDRRATRTSAHPRRSSRSALPRLRGGDRRISRGFRHAHPSPGDDSSPSAGPAGRREPVHASDVSPGRCGRPLTLSRCGVRVTPPAADHRRRTASMTGRAATVRECMPHKEVSRASILAVLFGDPARSVRRVESTTGCSTTDALWKPSATPSGTSTKPSGRRRAEKPSIS